MAVVKSEIAEKGERRLWIWVTGALVVVLLAMAMNPMISVFRGKGKPCHCAKDAHKYSGMVEDCCCDYETVDHLNEEVLHPTLQELVKTPFFRYFKAKLWCDCPFWLDDGMCHLRDCSVCECPESEFPATFKKPYNRHLSSEDLICQEGKPQAAVDRTLDTKAFKGWVEVDNPWTNDDETDNAEMTYVNLQLNPERYTGYTGPSARRIWDAIYTENCPKYPSGEFCQEKKILYKLISGLHSSISVHIASDYLIDEATSTWGQNLTLLYDRVLKYPDRVGNLYFTFLFVLRAATKAAEYLEQAEYDTGNLDDDLKTQSLMRQLLYNPKLQVACPIPFDEAKLWKGENGPELKQQIQKQFRNISALMDCVGCEKCRLWGKLQVHGLGTALKILFSIDGQKDLLGQSLLLQRNEVIALMNLLNRLSESLKFVHETGTSAEMVTEGQIPAPAVQSCPLLRIWASVVGTKDGQSSCPAPAVQSCPLLRIWASVVGTNVQSCPLLRIWASVVGTKEDGQRSRPAPASQGCPLLRIWASVVGTKEDGQSSRPAPASQGCPLQRMWKHIVGSR